MRISIYACIPSWVSASALEGTYMNLLYRIRRRVIHLSCALFAVIVGHQAHAYLHEVNPMREHPSIFRTEMNQTVPEAFSESEGLVLTSASEETDLVFCYGDQLDVSLRSVIDADGTVLEHTVFAFPNPSGWLVTVFGTGGQLLNFLPCQVEPINATGLWGGFIDPRLGHGKFSIPGIEGMRVRSVRFSSPGTKAAEDSEARQELRITDGGVLTEDGYVHRIGKNTIPIAGSWLFPKSYTSPIGTTVQMFCASKTCDFEYRIDQNLKLTYEIWVEENTTPANWIAIDQYVRGVFLGWIRQK